MGTKPLTKPPADTEYFIVTIPNTEITGEWNYPVTQDDNLKEMRSLEKINERPVILYIHGGGYIGMSAATHRSWVLKKKEAEKKHFFLSFFIFFPR